MNGKKYLMRIFRNKGDSSCIRYLLFVFWFIVGVIFRDLKVILLFEVYILWKNWWVVYFIE